MTDFFEVCKVHQSRSDVAPLPYKDDDPIDTFRKIRTFTESNGFSDKRKINPLEHIYP
jgi:hypothetical protein